MDPVHKTIKLPAIEQILRIPFIVLIALFPTLHGLGQVKFTTITSSQEIGRGEYLQVEFVVENAKQIDQLTPPDFPGFQIAQGPIQSSGMSIVNGNMSQYKAISFVLQPVKTGKFVIGGASATVDGKHLQSNTVTVTVNAGAGNGSGTGGGGAGNGVAGGGNGSVRGGGSPFPSMNWPPDPSAGSSADVDRDYILKPGENVKDKIRKNIFVKVQVNKTSCYVGEPIVATYKLYSRLSSESRVTRRPSLNGFSVYDMVDPNSDASSVERLNGKAYTVHIIRKTQLIPLQSGTIDLDPVEVENTVHFVKGGHQEARRSGNPLKDLFDQMTDDNAMGPEVEESVTLDTKPLSITVKPLPEESKPAIYGGAVGSFSIRASLGSATVAAKDEATLHVVVNGKGNLPVINAPQVQWPADVDAYEPHAKEDINKTTVPMSGQKTFDFVFTPRNPGHYTIPNISLPYFDPATQTYKTADTGPLDLQVTPAVAGKAMSADPAITGASPSSSTIADSGWKKIMQQHLEWIFTVIILSFVAFYLWRQNLRLRKTEQQQREEQAAAAKKAEEALLAEKQAQGSSAILSAAYSSHVASPVIQEDPLQESRRLFENGDYKGFYREVNRAVWKAVTKRLDLPASEHNKYNIIRQLESKGWGNDTTLQLESILNECEMNLYTPAYDTYNMQQLLRQTETLLAKFG